MKGTMRWSIIILLCARILSFFCTGVAEDLYPGIDDEHLHALMKRLEDYEKIRQWVAEVPIDESVTITMEDYELWEASISGSESGEIHNMANSYNMPPEMAKRLHYHPEQFVEFLVRGTIHKDGKEGRYGFLGVLRNYTDIAWMDHYINVFRSWDMNPKEKSRSIFFSIIICREGKSDEEMLEILHSLSINFVFGSDRFGEKGENGRAIATFENIKPKGPEDAK